MKCQNCKKTIESNAQFCQYCGQKISNTITNENENNIKLFGFRKNIILHKIISIIMLLIVFVFLFELIFDWNVIQKYSLKDELLLKLMYILSISVIAFPFIVYSNFNFSIKLRNKIKFLNKESYSKTFIIMLILYFIVSNINNNFLSNMHTEEYKNSESQNPSSDISKNLNIDTSSNSLADESEKKWTQYYEENQIALISVDSNLLYEYGEYYSGQYICTAIKIDDISNNQIKAHTDNNDSLFFSFIFNFDSEDECKLYSEDDYVIINGKVSEKSSAGNAVIIKECHVIGSGNVAEIKKSELNSNTENQKAYVENLKTQAEQQAAQAEAASKQEYIDSCTSINYNDVERNPNNYKDTNVKITGKVIQVSEGWFNSETLRVSVGGNYWYVTYTRKDDNESRILENDNVTIYGVCSGVTSYTSILGNTVTIPAISAKFIE